MTTEEATLAKRLAACEQFAFLEGMLIMNMLDSGHGNQVRVLHANDDGSALIWDTRLRTAYHIYLEDLRENGGYPLLNDWATVGCLLGIVIDVVRLPSLLQDSIQGLSTYCIAHGPDVDNSGIADHPGPALAQLLLEVWGMIT